MLALSPSLFPTTFGWPLEDLISQNLPPPPCNDVISNEIAANSDLLLDLRSFDHIIQQDLAPENSNVNHFIPNPILMAKKLNHNASERDRRKRVNGLYSFLRSLLPTSRDQKKKVSIPGTISSALKYIPELQKEVETLTCRKEKLLSCSSSTNNILQNDLEIEKSSANDAITPSWPSLVVSSVSVVGEKEVVIQLITSTTGRMSKKRNEAELLSKAIEYLEENEDDALVLVNATTFKCFGDERFLNTLLFQVQGDHKIEVETLKKQLCSFYHQMT